MSSYILDTVDENFDFTLKGKKYVMRYPTTGELEDIQKMNETYNELDPKSKEAKKLNAKLNDSIYQFITSVDPDTISIKEALKDENIKTLQNFNNMIKVELSV